ncbi:MAG TPA: Ig-like domain repeat protein, partial [Acidisarcina sp.]
AALKAYLAALQTPGSTSYHKYLTPEQFGARYGTADADIQAVSMWLQGHGLAVKGADKARMTIEFSGSIGRVQEAFHVPIHRYLVKGEEHLANASDPQIPAALVPVIAGVAQMNDFRARPHAVLGPRGVYNQTTKHFEPELTGGSGSSSFLYVGPADAATIYDSPTTLNRNFPSGDTAYDGTGVTIGIAGEGNIPLSAVATYRSFFALPAKVPTVIVDGDDPGVGDIATSASGEALLDVEIASGMAPGANVNLYVSNGSALQEGLYFAIGRAVDDNAVSILNVSFGLCEAFFGTTGNAFINNTWEQAAAQGITPTVSTGDNGSAGCDNENAVTTATQGLQVSGFASTPYNVAVGGTDFDILHTSFLTYVAGSNTTSNGGSALKYIPEQPWNNSTTTNTTLSSNIAGTDSKGNTNIVAGSGGASSCAESTTNSLGTISCAGAYAKPSWQKLFDSGDSVRDIPDVSMFASNGFYNAGWAICANGSENGVTVNDCAVNSSGAISSITVFGGTSTAAPAFAGVLALVTQKVGGRLGQADTVIYPLAKQFPAAFHDVTSGNISVPCAAGSPDCGTNHFLTGYNAVTGYDLASGLGSVDITALVNDWSSITFAASATALTLNGATTPLTITHGTPVTAAVTVTSASATPTGDVALIDSLNPSTAPDNVSISAQLATPLTLASNGTVSTSAIYLPGGGPYNVTAHYQGDGVVGPSDSAPVLVTVAPEASAIGLSLKAFDASSANSIPTTAIPYGSFELIDATPGSAKAGATDGLATGTVSFSGGGVTSETHAISSVGYAEFFTVLLPPGTQTITASYSGDASYNASTATQAITVVQAITSTSFTVSSAASAAGVSVASRVTPTRRVATWSAAAGTALACVMLLGIPARRRGWRAMLGLMVFACLVTLASGCGGGGGSSGGSGGGGGGGGGGGTTTTYTASATVATDSNGSSPSGTIAFKLGATTLATSTLKGGFDSSTGLANATTTGSFTSSAIATGANNVVAVYSGDTNYTGSTSPVVVVTK